MTSPKSEVNNHSTELSQLSLRRHELLQRKKLLLVVQELRGRADFVKSEDHENQKEIDSIEADLRELSQRRAELQRDGLKNPEVILDVNKLPPSPCRTQCPSCHQYIMTETSTSTNSLTWLACFTTAMIGCVAGCCLIPFCMDMFKSTTHTCPKCRAAIKTVKRF